MSTTTKKKSAPANKTARKASAPKATAKSAAPKKQSTSKTAAPKTAAPKTAAPKTAAPKKAAAKKSSSGNGTSRAKAQSRLRQQSDNIVTHEMIANKAYDIWAQNGYPHGMDMQNWLQAERELRVHN
jgi:hypothetical protein